MKLDENVGKTPNFEEIARKHGIKIGWEEKKKTDDKIRIERTKILVWISLPGKWIWFCEGREIHGF